ncbi:Transcriptional regulator, LysR family [Moritella sp. JT01]|uniref:LysR family transcriptional regulator n=1 Tax=Moritella sp. JT01 TaxID=756698 RepID=UPI000792A9B6|nr:LysR family transcriptional regulator [Moritella sp. JT01]KXO13404.1 Transcriptional regulator, LysR family [Moritella sp. JT01]
MNIQKVDFSSVDLNLLKLFDALLKERSVTRAGQRIGLSQPAASRGLARLRKLFNDRLVVRTSQGLELTPRATALSGAVTKLLDDAQKIVAPSTFKPSEASGKFTIATTDHMTLLLIPELLSKLAELAPRLDLEISASSGDNIDLVVQGDVDLAIGVYDKLPTRFYQRVLYDEDLVCLIRSDHPILAEPWTLESFASLSHISVIITGKGKSTVDNALAEEGLSRRTAVRLPHFLAAPMLVAESDMILSIPRRLAHKVVMTAPLKILEIPLTIKSFNPSIIWHERWHEDPAHIWLRNLLFEIGSKNKTVIA